MRKAAEGYVLLRPFAWRVTFLQGASCVLRIFRSCFSRWSSLVSLSGDISIMLRMMSSLQASVIVVFQQFPGQSCFGYHLCTQVGKLFQWDFVALPDKENAPGDRIAVIVVCQIDSFHDLGILDDGQLQVDHLQGKLQAFLFVEHQITDLKRREQPHADIIVARQVLAIDFGHGVAVYDRGYHIKAPLSVRRSRTKNCKTGKVRYRCRHWADI